VFGVAFLQRVLRATFNATPAKSALARVVAPGELTFAGFELDGARGAAESADCAAGTKRGIELDQAAKTRSNSWVRGEKQGLVAAPQILPEHDENVHDRNLMKIADETARTAKMSVHCQ
jgi:hypothetical protein